MSKARALSKAIAKNNRKFCELTDVKWIGEELVKAQWRARMIERADALAGPCCACARAVVIASTLWNGQDAVDQAWKRWVVQTTINWQTCLLSFASNVTCAFYSRILHRKGATCARGGVLKFIHVVYNDTIMHAVHPCTVAFSTQSCSSVVSVLILTNCARFVNGLRKRFTAYCDTQS